VSMFGMVFPDPQRQDRFALLFSLVAYNETDAEAMEAYMQPIMALRLRDCWVEKQPDGPPCLAVYTRNGGGNREHDHTDGAENCLGCRGDWATEHPAYTSATRTTSSTRPTAPTGSPSRRNCDRTGERH
jgi:hypothetical protein